MTDNREQEVIEAFVSLTNSLVGKFDVIDLLTGLTDDCARLLDVGSAGLLLADRHRVLHVAAATSERTRALELFQLQRDEGPCLDCYRSGAPVNVPDLRTEAARWPQFAEAALQAGIVSVHAIPMRLLDDGLGALGLFGERVGALNEVDLRLGQALAHVASVAIVTGGATGDTLSVGTQLQRVLDSRVTLEQAKGFLAEAGDIEMDVAFVAVRLYAHDHGQGLTEVAREVLTGTLTAEAVLEYLASEHARPQG